HRDLLHVLHLALRLALHAMTFHDNFLLLITSVYITASFKLAPCGLRLARPTRRRSSRRLRRRSEARAAAPRLRVLGGAVVSRAPHRLRARRARRCPCRRDGRTPRRYLRGPTAAGGCCRAAPSSPSLRCARFYL